MYIPKKIFSNDFLAHFEKKKALLIPLTITVRPRPRREGGLGVPKYRGLGSFRI